MRVRPFAKEDLPALLRLIARNAATRPVGHTYLMTSDVAWQFPGCKPEDNIRLWWDDAELAGFGWFQPPDGLLFDVREDRAGDVALLRTILDWAQARRASFPPSYPFYLDLTSMSEWAEAISAPRTHPLAGNRYLAVAALASDVRRETILRDHGFEPTAHFEPILTCTLRDLDHNTPTEAFTIRRVEEQELEARVALHAAAWAPAAGFNLTQYQGVRAISEVFDPDLDIVAVASDGRLASYTIAWTDPVSRIGSFEPFGTRPEFRGTGVSQAVMNEGLTRLADKGMAFARIYTAGFNHQAIRLYEDCGFAQVDRSRTYLKLL